MGIYEKIGKRLPHNLEIVTWISADRRQVNIGSGLVSTIRREIECIVVSDERAERGSPNTQMFIVKDNIATIKIGHQFIRNEMTYEVIDIMTEWLKNEKLHICSTKHLR